MQCRSQRVGIAVLALLASASASFGQVGRASITGIVRDSSGAIIPDVSIVATHAATGVTYESRATTVGAYAINALPIGEYTVRFDAQGFKQLVRSGIALTAGQIARIDPVLEVGQVTERLTITAEAPMLETETSQASESVSAEVFSDLPLTFGNGRNMAVFADRLVPGVSGSAWNMRIQGTPGGSAGVMIDGMTNLAGFLPGDFGEASISPEAIQEMTVLTGNVAAEHGRQAGGTMNFTLKSGTNQVHGSGFYYLRNEILNANDWNNNLNLAADPNFTKSTTARFKRPRDRRKDWGGSLGGPVYIPKIYDGRNRSFFYATMERFDNSELGPGSLVWSVPQAEMWTGNLSRLLTNRQVGTDALGRAVYEGQIFDPATLRQLDNGRYVADPFEGNIIPANRLSGVAKNFGAIFNEWYPPVNNDIRNNLYDSRHLQQNVKQYTLKADHSFNSNHKVSGYYYKHGLPRSFQESSTQYSQVWSLKDPEGGGPLSRGILQERKGYNWNASYDWIISPTMLNHASFGINNNDNGFYSRQLGKSFADEWGIKGVGAGQPDEQWTRPVISLGSSPVVTFQSWNHDANRVEMYRGTIVSNTFSWQRGAHSLKFGFEWNHLRYESSRYDNTGGTFNFAARTTGIPGESFSAQLGNSFASFLLGQVDSANITPVFIPIVSRSYGALFAQDTWKATSKLTLNYGLRWSGNSPLYEQDDRLANFNPTLPDPNYGNLPGAVEYMGDGSGRAGRRAVTKGYWKDFGPTFGFAYSLTGRTVLRGGYGISYTPEAFGWSTPWAAGFRETNTIVADSNGLFRPVFNIDNGYSGQTQPATMDPSFAARFGGTRYHPEYVRSGYVQAFNFGVQTQFGRDLVVEVEWRGNKGTRLHSGGSVRPNQIHPRELARGAALTQTIDSPEKAAAAGLPYPYAGFKGLGGWTLLPFPQLTNRGLSAFGDPVGFSTYHSGNLIVTKRMASGYYLYGAYTFAKNLTNVTDVANSGNSTGVQDTYNLTAYKTIAPDDRTHVLKAALAWDLPVGRGRPLLGNTHPVINALVGGWNVSAILNYRSGTPLGHPNSRRSPNFWNGPAVWANFTPPSGEFESVFNPDTFDPWNAASAGNRMFDTSVFSDAAPQSLGNSPVYFPTVRTPWNWTEDGSISKSFGITEGMNLLLRFEMLNMFNRHYFGGPDMNMASSSFGNIRTASGGRTGQLGARLEW